MNGLYATGRDERDERDFRRIFAVIVTFNPDLDIFNLLLAETRDQIKHIVVMDNGSRPECVVQLGRICAERATLHLLPANVGIAAAQNQGIAYARKEGATDVLLLDHDSVPAHGMVAALHAAGVELRASGLAVAAVGPLIIDRRTETPAPIPQIANRAVRFVFPDTTTPTRCEYLIASGTLIAMSAFDAVGPMNEAFFIDQVDVDWCFRANAAGFDIFCVPEARLYHVIGDEVVRFWLFGWRHLAVHSPARDYFYFRNSLRLILSAHTGQLWRRFWTRRLLRLFITQTVFVPPRWRRMRAMVSGAWSAVNERIRFGGRP